MFAITNPYDEHTGAYVPADLSGTPFAWNPTPVQYHGDTDAPVWPGRLALAGRMLARSPEVCPGGRTRWIAGGQILICVSCGLDNT